MNNIEHCIEFCEDNISLEEIKKILLKRNAEWIRHKDGSNLINDSLHTVVLSCIDSRVPVEKIFEAKPGELLVLKNAGNLITLDILRSVIVAIYELNAKFFIILGHSNCGMAIKDNIEKISIFKKKLGSRGLENIKKTTQCEPMKWFGFFNHSEWNENVFCQVKMMKKYLDDLIPLEKQPTIIPAIYDLETGQVSFL